MAKRKKPTPADPLQPFRDRRFFESWDEFVDAKRIKAAEASVRKLVEDLAALGAPPPPEADARRAVSRCVKHFNRMDGDGWICTIEREDIAECIGDLVEACGFEWDEDWLDDREW